jgi:hypothetical protein
MSYLPQQYYNYPAEYQAQFWQAAFSGLVGIAMLIAVGAWALSLVRKAIKGEEVEFPL